MANSTSLPYSDARVIELLLQFRASGDTRLRDAIVEEVRPLVQSVARRFAGRELQEDLEGEGYMGLMRAIERFAPGRGARFSTFATHLIAGQIRHYLRDRGYLIRQPAWIQELNVRVDKASRELEQRLQRTPTAAEIAAATNLSEDGVEELLSARRTAQVVRMQSAIREEDDDFLEVDPDKFHSRDYHTFELPVEDRIFMETAFERLKELEQKVLDYFYYQDLNQSEIARTLGISCNYAGYVLRNGLKHLRERMPVEESGVTDPLTRQYRAEHFAQRVAEELTRAQGSCDSLSLCVFRFPLDVADREFAAAAAALRGRVRRADVVGRTGHRELSVLLPRTGEVAVTVAGRLLDLVRSTAGHLVEVGTATFPGSYRTGPMLFSAARTSTISALGDGWTSADSAENGARVAVLH